MYYNRIIIYVFTNAKEVYNIIITSHKLITIVLIIMYIFRLDTSRFATRIRVITIIYIYIYYVNDFVKNKSTKSISCQSIILTFVGLYIYIIIIIIIIYNNPE